MKVLLVNTSLRAGGAAIAATRLMDALNAYGRKELAEGREGVEASMLVMGNGLGERAHFLWERGVIWLCNGLRRRGIFDVDIANCGTDITRLECFREADVIHLHWVNQGFLSLSDVGRIISSGKRVVWTLHDQWPLTGICHYSGDCHQFQTHCADCGQIACGSVAGRIFARKQRIYGTGRMAFVACSHWLEQIASQSSLAEGHELCSIPNTIDQELYKPGCFRDDLGLPADMKLVLFSAFKVTDQRKGIPYLIEAMKLLKEKYPDLADGLGVVVVGRNAEALQSQISFPVFPMGYVSDPVRMAHIYASVDAFVTPSLQDNLPNTIMEAMACGTPCVGFRVGGIPEMISHGVNGYVARYKDSSDLAEGIVRVLSDGASLAAEALRKVNECYNQDIVAARYIEVYRS